VQGALSGDSPKICPEYDAAKKGGLPDPEPPPVPKDRDPRL